MSVTDKERSELFNWFEEHMGSQRAGAMMRSIPPEGWAGVAMKRDLVALEERIAARFDRVDARFEVVDARFEAIDARFEAIDRRFEDVDRRLGACATKADLFEIRSDLQRTFVGWMIGMHAALVGVIGILLATMR